MQETHEFRSHADFRGVGPPGRPGLAWIMEMPLRPSSRLL